MTNRRLILPLLATVLGTLAFSATPALAGEVHKYCATCNIGKPGSEAGEFESVSSIAVNNATGDVYISDPINHRIDEFEADGTFMRAWGWEVDGLPGFGECTLTCQAGTETGSGPGQLDSPSQIAVDNSGSALDPSKEDVYVTDGDVVDKFTATGAYLGQITTGSGGTVFSGGLDGVAIDPRGLVWVEQASAEIDDYNHELVNGFLESRIAHGKYLSPEYLGPGLAVDSEDDLYVVRALSQGEVFVARLNSSGALLPEPGEAPPLDTVNEAGEELGAPQGNTGNGNKTGLAVDLSDDSVYLDMFGSKGEDEHVRDIEELAADGSAVEDFGSEQLSDGGGGAVAVNSATGAVYVADDAVGAVRVYTAFLTPGAVTDAVSDLHTEGSATLNGTVNPEGLEVTECEFEYISDAAFSEPYANEVQKVGTSGEFVLSFEGDETGELPAHASAAEVQSALEALPSIKPGNVSVEGFGYEPPGTPYTIEFKGALAHTKLPKLTATYGAITVTVATAGGDGGWHTASSAACEQAQIGEGLSPVPVSVRVSGLTPDTLYHYRLDAENKNGVDESKERVFVAPARPGIAGVSLSGVGSSTAMLSAQVNPGGALTSYRVEYGSSVAFGSSTAEASAGAGLEPTAVQVQLRGLQPEAVYYARIVAGNEVAVSQGVVLMFTTPAAPPPSASALPDGRVYELVSNFPAGAPSEAYVPGSGYGGDNPGGAEHGISTDKPFEVASGGEAVVYSGDPPPAGGTGNRGYSEGDEYLATRSAAGGWTQADLQPPGLHGPKYDAFSSDLSVGIVSATQGELGGEAGAYAYPEPYAHATAGGAGGEYKPLYTGTPPNRSQGEFGVVSVEGVQSGPEYDGANAGTSAVPAFSHLLFAADDALLAGKGALEEELEQDARQEVQAHEVGNYLYDRVGGRLTLVDVGPEGKVQPNSTFGSLATKNGANSSAPPGMSNAVSADGSRIFWTALETVEEAGKQVRKPKALYVRENDDSPDASTVLVAEGGEPSFLIASSEGSLVFYTKEGDLYSFDVETGQTTDLSVDLNPGEKAEVQGVLGANENGEYVYFAADGVLATNENANREKAREGQPNLYLSHAGVTTFIATLSPEDGLDARPVGECGNAQGCQGDWQTSASRRTAEVTPDGHSLVFMSNRRLTGYDSEQAGTALDEVFLYEAPAAKLRCVSCNPSSEPPVPTEFDTVPDFEDDDPFGAFIPSGEGIAQQPRVISDDGSRVFFDSAEPLVATDTNGWLDVYEWERDGAGTCTEANGCVYAISGGTDPENSYLIGTDSSGDDAFFVSRAALTAADRGNEGDEVYDARVDGVQPPPAAACEGTGCQGVPPTPPIFATPASATITGADDIPPTAPAKPVIKPKTAAQLKAEKLAKALKACRREKSKSKRKRCEASAHKQYGATKAKKAAKQVSDDRRAK